MKCIGVCNINNKKSTQSTMTLSLYGDKGDDTYSTYYNWVPDKEQWWITGFVPNPTDYSVEADELYAIVSVDFSENDDLFQDFVGSYKLRNSIGVVENVIMIDEEACTVWLVW